MLPKAQLEVLLLEQNYSFRTLLIEDERFRHPIHYHPEFELTYIIKSGGTRIIGDHIEAFYPGDLCLIGASVPHCYHQPTNFLGGAAAEVLQFSRDCGGGIIDGAPEWLKASQLLERAACGLRFPADTAKEVYPRMARLRTSSGLHRWQLFIDILIILADCSDTTALASPSYRRQLGPAQANRIQKACNYMLEHFAEPIRHKDIAQHVGMAPASLSRLFRSKTGQTCAEFLTSVRLGNACRLLRETDLTVTEIAYACGFQNLSNFHRRFRQKYQLNPVSYRRLTDI